jgi:hypothetical protein
LKCRPTKAAVLPCLCGCRRNKEQLAAGWWRRLPGTSLLGRDAHKGAVSLFERYGKSGDNSKLKAWATQTLSTLQHHLDKAQALDI